MPFYVSIIKLLSLSFETCSKEDVTYKNCIYTDLVSYHIFHFRPPPPFREAVPTAQTIFLDPGHLHSGKRCLPWDFPACRDGCRAPAGCTATGRWSRRPRWRKSKSPPKSSSSRRRNCSKNWKKVGNLFSPRRWIVLKGVPFGRCSMICIVLCCEWSRVQCYKTVYVLNLWIFVISQSVCL